ICLVPDVTQGWVYVPIALIGIGQIGVIVVSQVLVNKSCPKDARGSVAGYFSLCGSAGVLLTTKLGGFLFDIWWPGGTFIFLGIMSTLLGVWAVIHSIVSTIITRVKKKEEKPTDDKPVEEEPNDEKPTDESPVDEKEGSTKVEEKCEEDKQSVEMTELAN